MDPLRHLSRSVLMSAAGALVLSACGSGSTPETSAPPSSQAAAPVLTITSAVKVDIAARQVTLPLFEGRTADGKPVFYVVTDSSDKTDASSRGVNFSPKLRLALGTRAVQTATVGSDGMVHFPGTVRFGLPRSVTPGSQGFPPSAVSPGAAGDGNYTPLITTDGRIVINATQIANGSGQHNGVVSIDLQAKQVTLKLLGGFAEGNRVTYLRLDASSPVVAALEESTLAKNLDAAPGLASDSPATSSRSAIIPIVNGARGKADPNRQGLQGAVLDGVEPLNVQQSLPGDADYSPVWDVTPVVWTDAAIAAGKRALLRSAAEVVTSVQSGALTSGGDGPPNSSLAGLKAAGFISNCPTVSVIRGG